MMDKELQKRIETYIRERAETLNITVDTLAWSEDLNLPPGSGVQSAPPVYKLRVTIQGKPQVLTFTEEECHAASLPEDQGTEGWTKMTEKIDELLKAFDPKPPRIGY
jgi:hypothetical protein